MSPKMKQRLHVTRGLSTVEATLPSNIGGKGESYQKLAAHWKAKAEEYASWFADQEQYRTIL